MRFLLACSVVTLLVACALAAPGSYCSKADLEAYKSLIKGEFKGGEFGGLKNNLAAIEALILLGAPIKETTTLCESAKNALEGDLSSIVMGLKVRAALACPSSKIPDAAMAKIEEALSKTEEPVTQISALSAVSVLAAKGIDKTKVDEAVADLLEHLSNDGFKVHEDMENGSGYLTGLLLEALASLKAVLSKDVKSSVINGAVDNVKSYLSSNAVQDESTLAYPHHDTSVNEYTSTAILLDGLIKFNKAYEKKLGFGDEKVNKLARLFLSRVHIATIGDAHSVLLGLNSLTKGTWRKPLIITTSPTSLKASAKGDDAVVRFQITDIFGEAATAMPKLFLVALSTSEGSTPLITNQELVSSDAGATFEFNLLAIKPAPGNYKLTLSLTPAKVSEGTQPYAAIKATTRFVKVISTVEVSDLSLSVRKSKDSDESSATKHNFVFGKKASDVSLLDTDHLDFSFSVKSKTSNKAVTVQQAFILLSQGDDESELFFVAKYDTVKKIYSVQIPLARYIARFGSGGQFQLRLLIGDSYIDNSIAWDVCNMNVKLTEGSADRIAKVKADGLALKSSTPKDFAHVSSYKPQILHQFRPADKRAEGFIARAFTAITVAPLALFILGLLFVGLNFGACPDGLGIIYSLAFHVCIIANAYIIALFFFENNLFQTLRLLCYSVPPTIFVGHRALKAIALKRSQLISADSASQSK